MFVESMNLSNDLIQFLHFNISPRPLNLSKILVTKQPYLLHTENCLVDVSRRKYMEGKKEVGLLKNAK